LLNHVGMEITLKDVLHVPDLERNLVSWSKADAAALSLTGKQGVLIISNSDATLLRAVRANGLHSVECQLQRDMAAHTVVTQVAEPTELWCRRLGHAEYSTLAKMARGGHYCRPTSSLCFRVTAAV
jgi:hypothetical protein